MKTILEIKDKDACPFFSGEQQKICLVKFLVKKYYPPTETGCPESITEKNCPIKDPDGVLVKAAK